MGLISTRDLDAFTDWLARRGRSEGTISLYKKNLRRCADGKTLTDRLLGDLAPKTKRTNKAALAAWGKFKKDGEFLAELDEIKLPPATRIKAKVPLITEDWRRVVHHVEADETMPPHERATILIMARRGLRVSDVLRIEKKAAVRGISTGRFAYKGKGDKRIEIAALPIKQPLEMLVGLGKWETVTDLYGLTGVTTLDTMALCAQRVRRALARCAKALKIDDVHPHRLRRSYATFFLQRHKGDPQAMVKLVEHMAWSGISVASGYVDGVSADELDQIGSEMVEDLLK